MSKEAVKDFFEELERTPALKEKFLAGMKKSEGVKGIVAFGESHGFKFTEKEVSDLSDELLENSELQDEELAKASGGMSTQNGVLTSIATLGIGCAVVSIYAVSKKSSCATVLSVGGRKGCSD